MVCSVGIKPLSSKRLVGRAGNAFPSKEIKLEVVLMIFNAYAEHSDKNFLGISSCDILSSPMRQALLLLTERTFEAQRVGAESQTLRVNRCY